MTEYYLPALTVTRHAFDELIASPDLREKWMNMMLGIVERSFKKDDCAEQGHRELHNDWTEQENPIFKAVCLYCGFSERWRPE